MRLQQKKIVIHPSIKLAWSIANDEACLSGSRVIHPVHLLLAALKIIDDNFDEAAEDLHLDAEEMRSVVDIISQCRQMLEMSDEDLTATRRGLRHTLQESGGEPLPIHHLHRSGESRYLFQKAAWLAIKAESDELNLTHLLNELLTNLPEDAIPFFVGKSSINIRQRASASVTHTNKDSVPEDSIYLDSKPKLTFKQTATPVIDEIGRDLTTLAREGRLIPIVGRRSEMTKLARYLQRISKHNVIIVGEEGVGKTAVVEGFAQCLVGEKVLDFLSTLRIVQISVADLLARAGHRVDLDEYVRQVIVEATTDPNLVLFFEDIHLIVKPADSGESLLRINGILKPALAREDFRCIGVTTTAEFECYIKPDTAFVRRFQILRLAEPPDEEMLQICREWARRIEDFQEVKIEDEAIDAAVRLSAQLIKNRSLPDKAIDLLESAASFVKITSLSFSNAIPTKLSPRVGREQIERILEEQYGITVDHGESK